MSDSLNEFTKLYLRALEEKSYHTLIKDGFNYETLFRDAKTVSSIYTFFKDEMKLSNEDIIGFYLNNGHDNLGHDDIALVATILQTNDLNVIGNYNMRAQQKVADMKMRTMKFGLMIKDYIERINSFTPIEYTISERNEVQKYKIYRKDGDEVTEDDALLIFNSLSCTTRYPCIIYCNSIKEKIARCGNGFSVKFPPDKIDKLDLPVNSITLLNEIGEPITFDFSSKSCSITINPSKVNDDTFKKVSKFMSMIDLVEETNSKKVVGRVSFNVDTVIDVYSLFRFFITDPIASVLFFIDESTRAWCSKDNFYVFFRDFSYEMIDGSEIKTSENYLRLLIPTERNDNITGFTMSYSAKSHDMLPSFLYKFSRMLSNFSDTKIDHTSSKFAIQGLKHKIYTKPIKALSEKAGEFFNHESKSRSETAIVTSGDYYSRVCQAKDQPIIIERDEVDEWRAYGREPYEFPPKDWGFKETLLFICPKEEKPVINLKCSRYNR